MVFFRNLRAFNPYVDGGALESPLNTVCTSHIPRKVKRPDTTIGAAYLAHLSIFCLGVDVPIFLYRKHRPRAKYDLKPAGRCIVR